MGGFPGTGLSESDPLFGPREFPSGLAECPLRQRLDPVYRFETEDPFLDFRRQQREPEELRQARPGETHLPRHGALIGDLSRIDGLPDLVRQGQLDCDAGRANYRPLGRLGGEGLPPSPPDPVQLPDNDLP